MSSVIDFKGGAAIEAEARAWIVQLDGRPPSAEDLAALREWASLSPRHATALHDMAALWGDLDSLGLTRDAIEAASRRRSQRGFWAGAAVVAGALAALVIAAVFVGFQLGGNAGEIPVAREMYATVVGQQRTIALSDGSSVQLNTNSVLEIAFSSTERRLRLVRGEAYFDVAHDPERPFIVFADGGAVRAVGTIFVVRVQPEHIDVTVAEGAVELFSDAGVIATEETAPSALLAAMQTASMSPGSASIRSLPADELDRKLSWRNGILIFQNETLAQVVEEISRYTDVRITVADSDLRDLRVAGRFGVGQTEALFEVLEAGFGVVVTREAGGAVVLNSATPG